MNLAIINQETNIVENLVVPPEADNIWDPPSGFFCVLSGEARIGDLYKDGLFIENTGDGNGNL